MFTADNGTRRAFVRFNPGEHARPYDVACLQAI
jgi:hypothetical protein